MKNFLLKWLINIIALFTVIHIVAGVSIDKWQTGIIAALILGLLNAFLKPIIILFTFPFNVLSLGFFTLIINGFMFYLAAKFVKGFAVADFWSAFWAALIFSVVSFFLNLLFAPRIDIRAYNYSHMNKPKYKDAIDVEAKIEK